MEYIYEHIFSIAGGRKVGKFYQNISNIDYSYYQMCNNEYRIIKIVSGAISCSTSSEI